MKVLMPVLHYYPVIGGLETWTQNIAERISDKAEIFVVTGKVKNQPSKEIKNGVKISRISLFTLSNLSYSSPFYILSALPFIFLKSLALIKKEKIDVLHCQGFLSSFLGYFLSKIARVPYIVTVQRLEEGKGFLKKTVYRNAKVCITASSAIKRYFEEIGVKNIKVIPNGIDLERFKNLERKPHDGFIIMTVARLEKVKGIEYLIEAVSRFDLPRRSHLIIIGDGSERKNLESLSVKLGLTGKIRFLGQIPNEKIPEHLAAADCFVLPSLKEGFGIAILEAQAAGIPVIGTKVGGILDIIGDQKTGLLIPVGDPKALASAIYKIYSDSVFAKNLAENAKKSLEKYDWDKIAEKVYSIYQNI